MTSTPKQLAAAGTDPTASSQAVEDYVRAIFHTARGPRRTASTTAVARVQGVTPTSVSSMFKRLARLGLVVYVPYRGVSLTRTGERLAVRVRRRHRLLETFLLEVLGVPADRAQAEAARLQHHVSPELEQLIAARLGEPLLVAEPEAGQPSAGMESAERSDTASA